MRRAASRAFATLVLCTLVLCVLGAALASAQKPPAQAGSPQAGSGGGAPSISRWHGEYFPNTILIDQDGNKLRFYDDVIRGKVVAINFIFTTCTDVCPLDTAQLKLVQDKLGDRLGRDIFMYSISINSDSPEALRRYMRMYDVGPGWKFLTAPREDVTRLQRLLGLQVTDPGDLRSHSASVVLGNEKTAQWIRRAAYENPKNLVELLTVYLQNSAPNTPRTSQSYAAAPEVVDNTRGAYLFRTRCQACHTIGEGERLGPDLAGVAGARPAAWLSRWLREPDKMIAERDPIALGLLPKYRNLPMPNLGIAEAEAADLIEFMKLADAKRVKTAKLR